MLKEILKVMLIVLILLGVATRLGTPRNIAVSGAVSGNANFDGSGNINIATQQNNIAVIEGTMQLTANTSEHLEKGQSIITIKEINYPQGFSADNSVVISVGSSNNAFVSEKGLGYGDLFGANIYSQAVLAGAVPKNVSLQPNKILLFIANMSTQSVLYKYKITLLKIK